jgi:outer membrane protein
MKANRKKWIWITGMALLPFAVIAQRTSVSRRDSTGAIHQFTAQQAVEYGKKNNVQVKNALLDVKIQEQTNREVTGTALPQLSGSGSMTYNAKLPVSLVPAEFFGGPPGTFEKIAFGLK